MRTRLLVILACSMLAVRSQTTTYREIYDDPLAYKKLFINLRFCNMDLFKPNYFRVGANAEFMLSKRLWFYAEAEKSVLSVDGEDAAIKQGCISMEGGVVLNFLARVTKGKIVYTWHEQTGINRKTEYKLKVDGKVLRTMGLHGGMYSFTGNKKVDVYSARYTSAGIYAGIVFGAVRYKRIDADGIAIRHTSKATKGMFYIDAMFSPVVTYKDNSDYSSSDVRFRSNPGVVNLDTMVTKNYVGARIGWVKNFRYPVPLQYGFEAGIRPGLTTGYYCMMKFAIGLGFIGGNPKS